MADNRDFGRHGIEPFNVVFRKWWAFGFARRLTAILAILLLIASTVSAAIPPISTYDSEARTWAKVSVPAQTNTVTDAEYSIATEFMLYVKQTGLRGKIVRANLYLGSGVDSIRAPIIADIAHITMTTNDVLFNFVGGDYTTGGLAGDGSSKFLSTSWAPIWSGGLGNVHIGAYSRTSGASNGTYILMGLSDVTLGPIHLISSAANLTYIQIGTPSYNTGADTDGLGFNLHTRTSISNAVAYKNGVVVTTDTGVQGATTPPEIMFVHARNATGTTDSYTSRQLCFYTGGYGLTAAQAMAYYRIVQRAQVRRGRGL